MKKIYEINNDFLNCRIDRWYKKNLCNIPQSLLEKNIRNGNIKVNNKKIKSSYKLQLSDKIIINNFFPKKNDKEKFIKKFKPKKNDLDIFSEVIIEDNENFIVINKPSGIPVQSGTKSFKNIIDLLAHSKYFVNTKPYTVHRIDKDTSGLLIVAKNRKYAQLFTSLFRIRKIHKVYLAITIGNFEKKSGTFNDVLSYYEGDKIIKMIAKTNYKVIDSNKRYSLLKLDPITGRKHQLRRQLLIHGNPILGDSKYRIRETSKKVNNKLMLHAYKINFSINEKKFKFKADLNSEFVKTLNEKYLKNSLL